VAGWRTYNFGQSKTNRGNDLLQNLKSATLADLNGRGGHRPELPLPDPFGVMFPSSLVLADIHLLPLDPEHIYFFSMITSP
jgi:hypothetical protein